MADCSRTAMVLDDGGLPALVACMLSSDPSSLTAWFPHTDAPAGRSRLRAAERHVDLLGLESLLRAVNEASESERTDSAVQQGSTMMLLDAATQALKRGCSRLIWPCCFNGDLDRICRAADQSILLSRLIEMDLPQTGQGSSFEIETPLIDLSDAQIADLAKDLDAPLGGCWWCLREGDHPCGECDGCGRWNSLLSPVQVTPQGAPSEQHA